MIDQRDAFARILHDALGHLKRCVEQLNNPADLDGLLAAHFDVRARLDREIGWRVYCDPTEWAQQNEANLHQAPSLAVLGCLLSEQARRFGTVNGQVSDILRPNLGRLQQRQNVFALPNSWVLQPGVVLGVTLGVRAVTEPSLTSWMLTLLQEGIKRPDTPFFSRLVYGYAMALLDNSYFPQAQPSGSEYLSKCSIPELAFIIWLTGRGVLEVRDQDEIDWLDNANSSLIRRLLTETYCEERNYKAAVIWEVITSYVEARSRYPSLDFVSVVLQNFPAAMERWKSKWKVGDEYDVQSLLWLILRSVFDDVRYEECLPKMGRSGQRYDIGLPQLGLIVEAKYVREVRDFQRVVDDIGKDSAQLQPQSTFTSIVVFVYDESCSVEQHDWVHRTLESIALVKRAIIVCAPSACRPR
jgi:hypothetical protein